MKKITTSIILVSFLLIAGQYANGQTALKFGHINNEELVKSMPAYDSALVKLEGMRVQYEKDIELLQVEINNAYNRYLTESKNWSELVRQTKEEELTSMQQKLQAFSEQAQQSMTEEQNKLFAPIVDRADKAVKAVGKENGFIYIFDMSRGAILFVDETKSTDITPLVKTKLGIK